MDHIILEKHCDVVLEQDNKVLELAYLNSHFQTGLKNLLDRAILKHESDLAGVPLKEFSKVDEIPFDFVRKLMSVVVKTPDGKNRLIAKGAPEEIFNRCATFEMDGAFLPMDSLLIQDLREEYQRLSSEGFRVLALAFRDLGAKPAYSKDDEKDLILRGYLAFLDPPKDTARAAIAGLHGHGVSVRVLTGDNELVTQKICHDVGIESERMLMGKQIEAMSEDELRTAVENATVFARLSPAHKQRIIKAFQANGHTVGFMGDGINDAPALRAADVGISVDTAVDIAKESADIILLEKSLLVLEEAVIEGRKTFANIIKYIKMTASSNFGNVFSVLIASIFLPFLPMLPIQLLVQNLLYDISQVSIPWDDVDQDFLKVPRKWDAGGIARFMVFIGPISSIFDIVTFLLMWNVFGANTVEKQSLFQSGWFVVGLLTQTIIVHMIRTQHIPFIQSRAAWPVILLTASIMAFGIYLPFSSLGEHLGMVPLPLSYFPWLVGILLSYCVLTQLVKRLYINRFGQWL
jgi:Mg2+-importing ATPase